MTISLVYSMANSGPRSSSHSSLLGRLESYCANQAKEDFKTLQIRLNEGKQPLHVQLRQGCGAVPLSGRLRQGCGAVPLSGRLRQGCGAVPLSQTGHQGSSHEKSRT